MALKSFQYVTKPGETGFLGMIQSEKQETFFEMEV